MAAAVAASLATELIRGLIKDIAIDEQRTASLQRQLAAYSCPPAPVVASGNALLAPVVNVSRSRASSPSGPSPNKKADDGSIEACWHCGRQIGSAKYASHLSACMGISGRSGRGGERRAATNGNPIGRPSGSLNRIVGREGGYTSSDSEAISERKMKSNGLKRSATPTNDGSKLKKARTPASTSGTASPAPYATAPSHLSSGPSHPLSKTYSAPSPAYPTQSHSSLPMAIRPSLPHSSSGSAPPFGRPPTTALLQSDRPDSDSEDDSDDEVMVVPPKTSAVPQKRPGANGVQGKAARPGAKKAGHPLRKGAVESDTSSESGSDSDSD